MPLRTVSDTVALLKIEAAYGVAEVIAAANAILLMNTRFSPAADKLDRVVDRPHFGGDPFVLVGKRATLTAECDLLGDSTPGDAAPLGALYRICGHSETLDPGVDATYAPISTGYPSATVDVYWGGIKFRMLGARGSIDMDYSIKGYAKGTVNLTGLLVIPEDGAAPGPIDWSAFQTPVAIETETWAVTVGGTAINAQQLTLAAGATVPLIEGSENRQVMPTARKPNGTLKVLKDATLATWNPWSIANAHTIVTIQNTIAGGAGKSLSMPIRAQLQYPQPETIEGVAGFSIPFTAIPNAGGDEYSLVYT